MRKFRRIVVFIDPEDYRRADVLTGIGRFGSVMGDWVFYVKGLTPAHLESVLPLEIDGVIATCGPIVLETVRASTRAPIVCLNWTPKNLPAVASDRRAVGRMAAGYFLSNGFRTFGFVGRRSESTVLILGGFGEELSRRGCRVSSFEAHLDGKCSLVVLESLAYQDQLRSWLRELKKPAAVLTDSDDLGLSVCQRCFEAGIRVPDELAVLGVGNMRPLCELALPKLSSIELPMEQIGYEAASMLDGLMRRRRTRARHRLLAPLRVLVRGSSDVTAVKDPLVRQAMIQIRGDLLGSLSIEQLARSLSVSRSKLEKSFKAATGRTPFGEVRRLQIERVEQLLRDSDLPMERIAEETFFSSSSHLSKSFSAVHGMPPGTYRREFRMPENPL